MPPAPAIVVDNQGQQWVFVRGTDGALWGRHEVDGWFSLGGQLTSGPDALLTVDGRILVVARGLDGATWQIERDAAGAWGNWSSLGGLS